MHHQSDVYMSLQCSECRKVFLDARPHGKNIYTVPVIFVFAIMCLALGSMGWRGCVEC